jgi:hypothetical protein
LRRSAVLPLQHKEGLITAHARAGDHESSIGGKMTRHIVTTLGVALAFCCGAAHAAAVKSPVTTDYTKIKSIDTYSGDTTIFLENNPPGCEQGFWMRPGHARFKDNLKLIEDAAHQNTRVKIVGDSADLWKQLEERNCRLDKVSLEPVANPGTKADIDGENPVDERKVKEEEANKPLPPANEPR